MFMPALTPEDKGSYPGKRSAVLSIIRIFYKITKKSGAGKGSTLILEQQSERQPVFEISGVLLKLLINKAVSIIYSGYWSVFCYRRRQSLQFLNVFIYFCKDKTAAWNLHSGS
jgi:hypothetical protein